MDSSKKNRKTRKARVRGGAFSLLRHGIATARRHGSRAMTAPRFGPSMFRSFATRPMPTNVRLSLEDFDALKDGPSLKKYLSQEEL
jgi:hypothetical protein